MITEKEFDTGLAVIRKVLGDTGVTSNPVLLHTSVGRGDAETGELVETTMLFFGVDSYIYFVNLYETGGEVYRYAVEESWNVFPRDEEAVEGEVVSSSVEEEGDQNEED